MPAYTTTKPRLTLEGASRVLEAAIAKAGELGIPMSVAVVDDGGTLASFARMDGAALASVELAIDKAYTAAGFGFSTDEFFGFIEQDTSLLHGLTAHGRLALFAGAAPIVVGDASVGAVGVSGGRGPDDVAVVEAARVALG